MENRKYWIAAVSKDHVQKGKSEEIMQVCHGKAGPLKRIKSDDFILFYSSKDKMTDKKPLQYFTAVAQAMDDEIYQVVQFEGFEPFRRKVIFLSCIETPIRPLINDLDFIVNKQRWGYPFRYGLLEISEKDYCLIASKMAVKNEEQRKSF